MEEYNYEYDKEAEPEVQKRFSLGSQLLTVIQLILCALILAGAFVIKSIGGSLYAEIGTWFYDNYNNSIFTDTRNNVFSFVDGIKTTEKQDFIPQSDNSIKNESISEKLKSIMKKPLKSGTVTSGFGQRGDNSESEFHKGTDISADKGAEIYSMFDGSVTVAEKDDTYGNYVVITHSDNVKTLYAHCSELCVKKGDKIKAGQKIALAGSTGDSDGNHLHLEITVDGENINPQDILGKEYI